MSDFVFMFPRYSKFTPDWVKSLDTCCLAKGDCEKVCDVIGCVLWKIQYGTKVQGRNLSEFLEDQRSTASQESQECWVVKIQVSHLAFLCINFPNNTSLIVSGWNLYKNIVLGFGRQKHLCYVLFISNRLVLRGGLSWRTMSSYIQTKDVDLKRMLYLQ